SYMAPEQARGDSKHVGPAADVWALGVILYECLTGRPPFAGETALDTLALIGERDPVPPADLNPRVPRDLETVCLKCLEKAPDRRYASARDLADDLGRFVRDEPIQARPPSRTDRLRRFARRNKGPLAAVAAVFLALVAGLVGTGAALVRARHAEREARVLLAESYAQAGRLAVRRGAWRDALAQFDRALEAGHPDQAELHLQKVRAWSAVHDLPHAAAELDDLAARPDLGELAGPVLLWRADLALCRGGDEDAALGLARQALAAGLPSAEREYAYGLLAATSSDAVRHFERAVAADPFHQRANAMLALTLVMLGKMPAARERVTAARLLFPEDPTFPVLEAMAHAWDGDMPAARAALDVARNQLGVRQTRAAERLLDLMRRFHDLSSAFDDDPNRWAMAVVTHVLPAATAAGAEAQAIRQAGDGGPGLLVPIPPVLITAFRRPLKVLPAAVFGGRDRVIDELDRAYHVHPDAFLAFTHGVLAFDAGRLPEAERAFLDAAGGLSIIPVPRVALAAALFCQWERADREPAARDKLMGRAVLTARRLVDLGHLRPWQAALVASVAIEAGELDLARWVIADWERQAPKDVLLWRKRLAVELRAKAYGPAIAAADKLLKLVPNDADALRARHLAVEQLTKQAQSATPP
ncbi:MAG TPA: protein kinase, partial [Gemmataceae bacterium]